MGEAVGLTGSGVAVAGSAVGVASCSLDYRRRVDRIDSGLPTAAGQGEQHKPDGKQRGQGETSGVAGHRFGFSIT